MQSNKSASMYPKGPIRELQLPKISLLDCSAVKDGCKFPHTKQNDCYFYIYRLPQNTSTEKLQRCDLKL